MALGDALLAAFTSSNGVAFRLVASLRDGVVQPPGASPPICGVAAAGTLTLECRALARLSGRRDFEAAVDRADAALRDAPGRLRGHLASSQLALRADGKGCAARFAFANESRAGVGAGVDSYYEQRRRAATSFRESRRRRGRRGRGSFRRDESRRRRGRDADDSVGTSRGDAAAADFQSSLSFCFRYLLKAWLQDGKPGPPPRSWLDVQATVSSQLVRRANGHAWVAELRGNETLARTSTHLACFWPGLLALAQLNDAADAATLALGEELLDSCVASCVRRRPETRRGR